MGIFYVMKFSSIILLLVLPFWGNAQCDKWLNLPSYGSYVTIGDLDIPGTQLTVEAVFNRTQTFTTGTGDDNVGDIVSKHLDPSNINYLLRPNAAYITTTNGFYGTPSICDFTITKTYHVAMVYDGTALKFYRNGFLMSQVAATGNLYQNDFPTRIGLYTGSIIENMIGYINEVRIWKVVRTQQQIRDYMSSSLPNPASQPGLLAYYTFDNLNNKQGNSSWDGTISGNATINNSNPQCPLIIDSCAIQCLDSIQISYSGSGCRKYDFSGSAFPASTSIQSWYWDFGDGSSGTSQNITHTFPVSGTYTVALTVTNAAGCKTSHSVAISTSAGPDLGPDKSLSKCSGMPSNLTSLFSITGLTQKWLLGNTAIPLPVSITQPDTYTLIATDNQSCSDTAYVALTDYPKPTIGNDRAITHCQGLPVRLDTSFATGALTQTWSLNNIPVLSPYLVSNAGQYQLIVTNTSNCSDTAILTFQYYPAINLSVSNDTSICKNSSVQLFAQGATSYQWAPTGSLISASSATPVASPSTDTKYHVYAKDMADCNYEDSVMVTILQTPAFTISKDQSVCLANSNVNLSASGGNKYSWSPATLLNDPFSANPIATAPSTTTFSVQITETKCNYSSSLQTTVIVSPLITVKASKSNDIDCSHSSAQLAATGAENYEWSPADGLSDPASNNPVATIHSSQKYYVKGTTSAGCSGSDSLVVNVAFDNASLYLLPNVFTPNGDNLNDCFGPKYWGYFNKLKFYVYNRWGQLVFYTENAGDCWDGKYKGKPAETGNYVYHIIAETLCGKTDKKGNILLIR